MFKPRRLNVYPNSARTTGCLIIGQPGTGKTRHLEAWIMDDILAGRNVGVFDVHGPLYRNILYRLASQYPNNPQLARRLVIIDPCQPEWVVPFNPLAAIEGMPLERVAAFMADVIIKIWNINPAESPRMAYLMAQSFLALADLGLGLLDLPRFLQDKAWRKSLLPQLTHQGVRLYFTHEFPTSPKDIQQWITPLLNKIGPLLFDPDIGVMFSRMRAKISFRKILDGRGTILLVHLPKGTIGEGGASLLGALLMAQIQKAALSRDGQTDLRQFYLYLDEFQNYTTTHISDALAESRKFGLSLVMAHQFLGQIENEELRSAVINTTGTLISFRIGYEDARNLVTDIFPYPHFLEDEGLLTWEDLALELANLPNRVSWLRRRGPYEPVRKFTREMQDPVITPEVRANLAKMLAVSGQCYGRSRSELLEEQAGPESWAHRAGSKRKRRRQRPVESGTLESNQTDLPNVSKELADDEFYT